MRKWLPSSFYNPVTFAGAAIAGISFGLILFLMLLESFAAEPKPYMGIIAFVILPSFLIIGLLLIAFGIIREHRRESRGKHRDHFLPKIDLNDPKHRRAFTIFSVGTILLLLFSAFGSYKAYEYTDSVQFCGTICHKVMNPEYTAYQHSPHAHVDCVKCHIGPGADWYVRSKITGAYQVYSVLFNKYPRPIPTPIKNLRPARETCEQCHWPKAFYSKMEKFKTYYLSDEDNTRMTLTLSINIGGGNPESGVTSGIHWHMNIANEITYIASDEERQVIPWVKIKSPDGKETIYRSTDVKLPKDMNTQENIRKMDCIDCHNRPSHIYHPPASSVNDAMAAGFINPHLPYIKSVSVQALEAGYTKKEIALDSIKIAIEGFYNVNYPDVAAKDNAQIEKAIQEVQKIYSLNYFPEMNVSWKKFPDNIGHLYSPGCFRCHDGKHVSSDGKVISKDCNVCHTIFSEQFGNEKPELSLTGVKYRHPINIGDSWKEMECSDCHSKN
ncbi:MAG: NapC/NirT family cytochrome c [Ignavibacteriaceae bacterium]